MLDRRVKQRLEVLGYAVEANELGFYATHHGQLLAMDGDMNAEDENRPATGVRERANLHRAWDNMAWDIALKHSKTHYLVLTSRRLGNKFDVHRGGVLLPCRVELSYAGAMAFVRQEQAAGRCVQVVTEQRNGMLQTEETEP